MKGLAWVLAALGVGFVGVFVLPWYIPVGRPVQGESYSFGFSNKAAVLALAGSLVLMFIGLMRNREKSAALSWFMASPVIFPPYRQAAREYQLLGGATLLLGAAVLAWNAYLKGPYFGESNCFLGRIDLARLGYRPYTDFQFPYGPAFIYAPIFLDHLSGNTLGSENAFAGCVILGFLLGFVFLFVLQRFLHLPERDRPWILALTLLIWFYLTLGLQYTPLRYALLPCALAVGSRCLFPGSPRLRPGAGAILTVAACSGACYLISPEMGIAGTVGFAASACVHFWARRIFSALAGLVGLSLSVALVLNFSSSYLHTVFAFAAGAYNFPIYPNLANLLLVTSTLYVLPKIACAIWQEPENPVAPLAAALGAGAAALLPVALGRCDPGHVLCNGLCIYLLLFAALAQVRRSWLTGWGALFGFVFILLGQLSYWGHYRSKWRVAVETHNYYAAHPDLVAQWTRQWKTEGQKSRNYALLNWHKVVPFPELSDDIKNSRSRLAAPLGEDVSLDRYLKIRPSYHPEYYPTVEPETFTPRDVARLVADTKSNYDFILIPAGFLSEVRVTVSQPPSGKWLRGFLTRLMVYPIHSTFRNPPYVPQNEIAAGLFLLNSPPIPPGQDYLVVKMPP